MGKCHTCRAQQWDNALFSFDVLKFQLFFSPNVMSFLYSICRYKYVQYSSNDNNLKDYDIDITWKDEEL